MSAETDISLCPGCFDLDPGGAACPRCGYDAGAQRSQQFLAHGYLLAEQYRIGRVLGKPGGFGITYLAWDINLEQKVAIKEFLPALIATRKADGDPGVTCPSEEDRESFDFGREQFLAEARTLARLEHPNVLRLRSLFNANGTAYLVMDYHPGQTLADRFRESPAPFDEEVATGIMLPILRALQYIHDRGYLHRDVKPSNIYLAESGKPILLDFGSARRATSSRNERLSVILTEGYAPIEQYGTVDKQGPWTDVYGAAATIYRMLTGRIPPVALDRIGDDTLSASLDTDFAQRRALGQVLHRALAIRTTDRTPSARIFADELESALVREDHGPAPVQLEPGAPAVSGPEPETAAAGAAPPEPLTQPVGRPEAPRRRRLPEHLATIIPTITIAIAGLAALVILEAQDHSTEVESGLTHVPVARPAPPTASSELAHRSALRERRAQAAAHFVPTMVEIPGGEFHLQHGGAPIELPPFSISRDPVSGLRFAQFVAATGQSMQPDADCATRGGEDPAVCIDHHAAREYCDWLSRETGRRFRLPTAAEWVYLAQGGAATTEPFKPMNAGVSRPRPYGVRGLADGIAEWSCSRVQAKQPVTTLRCHSFSDAPEFATVLDLHWPIRSADAISLRGLSRSTRDTSLGFRIVEER